MTHNYLRSGMPSKTASQIPPLKRQVSAPLTSTKHAKIKFISERHTNVSDEEIIRSRLLYEGDQGSDDRRILTLTKTFHKSPADVDKLHSFLYSIEHSYRLLKSAMHMEEHEQVCYASKIKLMRQQIEQLRDELKQNEARLTRAKRRCLDLHECDQRIDAINRLDTRQELRAQQAVTLERKRYFEHLQQTFEASFQQRLRQIAIYMRPIADFDEILKQDAHEDGVIEPILEQQSSDRRRTYSDSSITSMDGEDSVTIRRAKTGDNRGRVQVSWPSDNQPQPLFCNATELYGAQLVNPLVLLTPPVRTE